MLRLQVCWYAFSTVYNSCIPHGVVIIDIFFAVDSQGASRSLPPAGRYERAGECGLDFTVNH